MAKRVLIIDDDALHKKSEIPPTAEAEKCPTCFSLSCDPQGNFRCEYDKLKHVGHFSQRWWMVYTHARKEVGK